MNSNTAFELQMLYNRLLKNSRNKAEKEEIEQLFTDFISACKSITPADMEESELNSGEAESAELVREETNGEDSFDMEQYNTAFNLFRKILDKQHILVFKPYYNNTFAGKKIENKSKKSEAFQGIEEIQKRLFE